MKLIKTYQGQLPENKILNTKSTSQTDTYSCDYINKNIETLQKRNNYYTEEQITGNWIDGKPIYRKVFVGNWISNTLTWNNLVKGNISNCDTVISIKGVIKNPRNGDNIPIPSYENTNYFANIMYNQSDDYIKCFLNGWTYSNFQMKYVIILEYTKTTD